MKQYGMLFKRCNQHRQVTTIVVGLDNHSTWMLVVVDMRVVPMHLAAGNGGESYLGLHCVWVLP